MKIEDLPIQFHDKIKLFGTCWLWTGAVRDETRKHKQPCITYNGKLQSANRVIYELLVKPIEEGKQLNHEKDCVISDLCVNPKHVYEGTQAENIKDRDSSGNNRYANKTLCNYGHELSTSPTTGHRFCQTCKNKRRDEWRKRNVNK